MAGGDQAEGGGKNGLKGGLQAIPADAEENSFFVGHSWHGGRKDAGYSKVVSWSVKRGCRMPARRNKAGFLCCWGGFSRDLFVPVRRYHVPSLRARGILCAYILLTWGCCNFHASENITE